MKGALLVMGALGVLGVVSACKRPTSDIVGIGQWSIKKTKLRDASGLCQPTELPDGRKGSWCYGQPPVGLAGHAAEVDLYFDGTTPDANLVELQLKVRGCEEGKLETWMRAQFGKAIETRSSRGFWQNGSVFAAALLPSDPGQCLVRILPLSEKTEIARIRKL